MQQGGRRCNPYRERPFGCLLRGLREWHIGRMMLFTDPPTPHTPETLLAQLDDLGIAHVTVTHPPLFTVEQSKQLRGDIPGAHVKNLFLKDRKGGLFLVTAVEDTRIDLKRLHEAIGAAGRVSFASADLLFERLGVLPGAVTPFGVVNDRDRSVSVVLDRRLLGFDRLNCHPLVNTRTTGVSPEGLLAFLDATGHKPQIVDLEAVTADGAGPPP